MVGAPLTQGGEAFEHGRRSVLLEGESSCPPSALSADPLHEPGQKGLKGDSPWLGRRGLGNGSLHALVHHLCFPRPPPNKPGRATGSISPLNRGENPSFTLAQLRGDSQAKQGDFGHGGASSLASRAWWASGCFVFTPFSLLPTSPMSPKHLLAPGTKQTEG